VRERFQASGALGTSQSFAGEPLEPADEGRKACRSLRPLQVPELHEGEIYLRQSDTSNVGAFLSGRPRSNDPSWWLFVERADRQGRAEEDGQ